MAASDEIIFTSAATANTHLITLDCAIMRKAQITQKQTDNQECLKTSRLRKPSHSKARKCWKNVTYEDMSFRIINYVQYIWLKK